MKQVNAILKMRKKNLLQHSFRVVRYLSLNLLELTQGYFGDF